MGCKARHKKSVVSTDPEVVSKIIIGEEGITLVEYIGWFDIEEYIGSTTGTVYRFGIDRPRGYVDNRDLDKLLEITEDGERIFRKWQS